MLGRKARKPWLGRGILEVSFHIAVSWVGVFIRLGAYDVFRPDQTTLGHKMTPKGTIRLVEHVWTINRPQKLSCGIKWPQPAPAQSGNPLWFSRLPAFRRGQNAHIHPLPPGGVMTVNRNQIGSRVQGRGGGLRNFKLAIIGDETRLLDRLHPI